MLCHQIIRRPIGRLNIAMDRRLPYPRHAFLLTASCFSRGLHRKPTAGCDDRIIAEEEIFGRKRVYTALGDKNNRLIWKWKVSDFKAPGMARVASSIWATFLPINYPSSVHPCYLRFHLWQAMETYVGAVVMVLCSQAMLESLGVGASAQATAGAIAVQWVLKDGIAELGKLIFIRKFAKSFDSHPKTWKAVGEVLTTIGSGIQLCTLLSPQWFLALASTGNIFKSTSWALWGATHMCFIRNFANSNNVGDLTAKADSQGALAQLCGWLTGVCLISFSHSPGYLFALYGILAPFHVLATRGLLREANFQTLNLGRTMLIIQHYMKHGSIPLPAAIEKDEVFFGEYVRKDAKLPMIELAAPLHRAFVTMDEFERSSHVLTGEEYLIGIQKGSIYIVLRQGSSRLSILKSLVNAMKFHGLLVDASIDPSKLQLCNVGVDQKLLESHQWTLNHFPQFVAKCDANDWQTETIIFNDSGIRAVWPSAHNS